MESLYNTRQREQYIDKFIEIINNEISNNLIDTIEVQKQKALMRLFDLPLIDHKYYDTSDKHYLSKPLTIQLSYFDFEKMTKHNKFHCGKDTEWETYFSLGITNESLIMYNFAHNLYIELEKL